MEETQREPLLQFFEFAHLPQKLQGTSAIFFDAACKIIAQAPRNPERTVALRKLLESKDCAVRAMIYKSPEQLRDEQIARENSGIS